jgi:hypothetical protein
MAIGFAVITIGIVKVDLGMLTGESFGQPTEANSRQFFP